MTRNREKDTAIARLASWEAAKNTKRYANIAPKIIKEIKTEIKSKWPDELANQTIRQ